MSWKRIQHNPVIIIDPVQDKSASALAPHPMIYSSPLLSTPSFSSSISTLSSLQSIPSIEFSKAKIIQKQVQQIEELREDLVILNQKYVQQIERSEEAEQKKAEVENEIEDLSHQLFEQANAMVAKEKKAQLLSEQKLAETQKELNKVQDELQEKRSQLKQIREKLEKKDQIAIKHEEKEIVDPQWLHSFKEVVEASSGTPFELVLRMPFLKLCLTMDIQPCLYSGIGFSKSTIKRLLGSIVYEPCFIENATSFQAQHQESTKKSSLLTRFLPSLGLYCYGCGSKMYKRAELFRFKLKEQDVDWQYIDYACRNRLVAVCDFYTFIRHVRSGLQATKDLNSLFEECFKLRLAMFYARSGMSIKR
ncbi:hypothetical protein G6F43_007510 [Rhizopus delemar]|nr:hypothetical protein G6F43_007510 [Rhizopus delemar]